MFDKEFKMTIIQSIEDGRKEDGNRSIANKIISRLDELDKTVENNQGRWAWELLQNAKDSIAEDDGRTVSVQIELNHGSVEFRHNGTHFTELDIRGLINQISSKETEEGQVTKKTGRFGTGFLTTHLLSRCIKIKGIVKTQIDGFCHFDFLLDRRGKTTNELTPKIESAWESFHGSIQRLETGYDEKEFNTSFSYLLESDTQKTVSKIGIEEFSNLIPFVLVFIPKIDRVEIINNVLNVTTVFKNSRKQVADIITPIEKTENGEKTEVLILNLTASNQKITIATEVEKIEKSYSVKNISHIPKLFCDFPLIGTENFNFPVIVNSFFFNPQKERDGIWLKGSDDIEVKENQELIENAMELYKSLISHISEQDFFDLYNLVETRMPFVNENYFDTAWYKSQVQQPIKDFIITAKIVEIEGNNLGKKSINELWFPLKSCSEQIRSRIWQFGYDLCSSVLCKKLHLNNWCGVSWDGWQVIDITALMIGVANQKNIINLSQLLGKDENETFQWLNSLCEFILEDDLNCVLFDKNSITPNQHGHFRKISEVFIDEIENEELVNILELLGEDWKELLLNKKITFGKYGTKSQKDIADKITEKMNKTNETNKDDSFKKAVSLLLEWFENNPKFGKELFSELYNKRPELFMNIFEDKESILQIMRSGAKPVQILEIAQSLVDNPKIFQKVSELDSLLAELNISEVSQLRGILETSRSLNTTNSPIAITQETLLSLGVTSAQELEDALKDKSLFDQFSHISTPTKEMFEYVQTLIDRSKQNVIQHLNNHPEYDCTDLEELATTVIGGITKQGLPINVVIRPSDNRQVIVYYSSEKDTLDFENAELWIDNGKEPPRHLTLGKILKNTGIKRIPV